MTTTTTAIVTILSLLMGSLPLETSADEPASPEEGAHAGAKGLDFTPHRLNYFVVNDLPGDPAAQVKFQISAKYQFFEGNLRMFSRNVLPLYFAYTQKSFWDIGRPSAPFEENNYNPEAFLDYPVSGNALGLQHVIVSGEHESNGRDGAASRSWNRLCLRLAFGIEGGSGLERMGVLQKEKFSAYLKLWKAFGTEDQDDLLESAGSNERFVDYAGIGEIGLSVREVPIVSEIRLLRNNQLDFRTRIPRNWDKRFVEINYHQNVPTTNFFLYVQYWNGYGESLQRFDRRDRCLKVGFSFFFSEPGKDRDAGEEAGREKAKRAPDAGKMIGIEEEPDRSEPGTTPTPHPYDQSR